jgi:hypothetical protein
MRSFVRSSCLLALAIAVPGCLAGPADVGLRSEDLDQQAGPADGEPCHVDSGGGTTGPVIDGHRDGIWCCGSAECTDREACGEDFGNYVEACAACDYYECIPDSGLGPGRHTIDLGTFGSIDDLAIEIPRSSVRLVALDLGILRTLDVRADRDLGDRLVLEGSACAVDGVSLLGGVLRRDDCCPRHPPTSTDRCAR